MHDHRSRTSVDNFNKKIDASSKYKQNNNEVICSVISIVLMKKTEFPILFFFLEC